MLVRIAAYTISGLLIWGFAQGGTGDLLSVQKHLALDPANAMVFGVCSGISNYIGLDVSLVRMAFAAACLYKGIGFGIYILAFLLMPGGV